ncbi:hypothetical protein [Zwartia vadi]|uniref:hypothetical protein n=1 Tax=Zwartia vadi TaxID=3058168 RepID=UPI0025B5D30E|nr:hypothetical protein [Zwartia vadi]MDN3986628.1 hypothetical protein [Zwartia vadi]
MQSNKPQAPQHLHAPVSAHGHGHYHDHGHEHGHAHEHVNDQSLQPVQAQVADLKSPVLMGLIQRLLWIVSLLLALWLVVFWALRTNV